MKIDLARIYLRPLHDADCTEQYVGWLNDPQVNHFLEVRHTTQTLESVRAFVRNARQRDEFHFGIFDRTGNKHVGNIKVGPIFRQHSVGDVSLFIGERSYWGRGLAAEAISGVSRYSFQALDVQKLSASMYVSNEASRRAFLKCGYREEGLRRAHYLLDGNREDILELGLLPRDMSEL